MVTGLGVGGGRQIGLLSAFRERRESILGDSRGAVRGAERPGKH
jgi:hypothetical protein